MHSIETIFAPDHKGGDNFRQIGKPQADDPYDVDSIMHYDSEQGNPEDQLSVATAPVVKWKLGGLGTPPDHANEEIAEVIPHDPKKVPTELDKAALASLYLWGGM